MADQTIKEPQMTLKEAVPILYLAQHDYRAKSDYEIFCDAVRGVPWDFNDERFLSEIEMLKDKLVIRLELNSGENVQKVADETYAHTLSKDEREGMENGLREAQAQRSIQHENIHTFAKSAVDDYIKKLKEAGVGVSPEQESTILTTAAKAAQRSIDKGDVFDLKTELSSITKTAVEIPPEVQEATAKASRLSEITEVVLTSEDNVHRGVVAEQCLADQETPPKIIAEKYKGKSEVEKILSLPEEIKQEINKTLENPVDQHKTLRQAVGSASGLPRDVIAAVGGENGKAFIDDAISWITGDSLKKIKEKAVARGTPIDAEKLKLIEQWVAQRETIRKTSRAFFNQALFESAATAWGPKIQTGLMVYLESVTFKASIHAPEYFHYVILAGTDAWNAVLGRATKQVAGEAAKKAGASLLKKGAGRAAGAVAGAVAGLSAGPGGSIIGGIIGFFRREIIGRIVSFVGGLGSLLSVAYSKDITAALTQAFGAPQRRKSDEVQLGGLVGILCVIGLLSLSGMAFVRETTSTAAIVAEKEEGAPGTENHSIDLFETIPDHPTERDGKILNFTTHCLENPSDPRCTVVSPPPRGVVNFKADRSLSGLCARGGGKITNWKQAASERVKNAITQLEKSPVFMGLISTPQGQQTNKPINVYYVEGSRWTGGCYDGNIYLYNAGGSTDASTLYTLAHELGHALADRQPDIYGQFIASGMTSKQNEGWLPTYPNKDSMSDREDFAETVAMYASNHRSYPAGYINHYNFAKSIFGNVVLR